MNKHQKVMAGIEKRINNLEAENKKLLDTLERYRAALQMIAAEYPGDPAIGPQGKVAVSLAREALGDE